jgi:hypothetical protein
MMRELLKFFFKSASSLKQFIFVGFNMRTYKQRFDGILDELMDIAYAVFLTRVGWIWQPLIHIRVPVPASQGAMSGQIIFMHKWGILAKPQLFNGFGCHMQKERLGRINTVTKFP